MDDLASVLTFPTVRRHMKYAWDQWPVARLVIGYVALFLAEIPYALLRGTADNTGMPYQNDTLIAVDRWIGFGETPTERLQDWLYSGTLGPFGWFFVGFHVSWFFVPSLLTLYVLVFRRNLFPSLVFVRLGTIYAGLVGFFLLPTEPPWMALDVSRLVEIGAGTLLRADTNPVAAFPSLHVALPAALAFWLWAVRMRNWTWLFSLFTILTAFEVIYMGEHYAVDALAGLLLAAAVVWPVQRISRPAPGSNRIPAPRR